MMVKLKIRKNLYETVLEDLRRPHAFAAERIGFLTSKLGNGTDDEPLLVFLTGYISIPDSQYIEDNSVGARINSDAIRSAMQHVLDTKEGVFHVHLHDWAGLPAPGKTDRREIPPIVKSFCNVGPNAAHGMLILSSDKAMAIAWVPNNAEPIAAERISVVGHPLLFLES